jgi:hypothetical protein
MIISCITVSKGPLMPPQHDSALLGERLQWLDASLTNTRGSEGAKSVEALEKVAGNWVLMSCSSCSPHIVTEPV